MPGLFIAFEGGEGAGKTTQINKLAENLTRRGHEVLTTREPGGTPEAEKIRNFLVQRESGDWTPAAEVLLLFAARSMHVEKLIRPALAAGKVVISDRFLDSTRAYQGYGHGFPMEKIEALKDMILDGFDADLTFILDIDPQTGLARAERRLASESLKLKQQEDRFENLGLDFHERLRQGFLDIAKNNPQRCHVIDAAQPVDAMAALIEDITLKRLAA